jgi:hypothetical protein
VRRLKIRQVVQTDDVESICLGLQQSSVEELVLAGSASSSRVDAFSLIPRLQSLSLSDFIGVPTCRNASPSTSVRSLCLHPARSASLDCATLANVFPNLEAMVMSGPIVIDGLCALSHLTRLHMSCSLSPVACKDLVKLTALSELHIVPPWGMQEVSIDLDAIVRPLCHLTDLHLADWPGLICSVGIATLASLRHLKRLNLDGSRMVCLRPLLHLTSLCSLHLRQASVPDDEFSCLSALVLLHTLDLSSTRIVHLQPLSALLQLRSLWLKSTYVADLTPLSVCKCLRTIDLQCTLVTQVNALAHCAELRRLCFIGLRGVRGGVRDMRSLTTLRKLRMIVLDHPERDPSGLAEIALSRNLKRSVVSTSHTACVYARSTRDSNLWWQAGGCECEDGRRGGGSGRRSSSL